ncbi:MAG: putative HIT-like protein [Puniceicoccaceae bacterium MED-G32]|nr:MAG: putative HIT-like protein [Puniceicoccaceae bacterium MED-G32]
MSFEAIISGAIPSYKIAENKAYLAFLEKAPLAMGHIVVIPKEKSESIFDMEDRALSGLHIFAKEVALKLEAAIPCQRIGMAVIGLEVAYAHIHLIPLQTVEDINFTRKKLSPTEDELKAVWKSMVKE